MCEFTFMKVKSDITENYLIYSERENNLEIHLTILQY